MNKTTQPTQVKVLTMTEAVNYVEQMKTAITGGKLTPAQELTVRLHTQANFSELFKSLVLMPIDNNGNTIGDIYGKAMSQWCANHALRSIAFGTTSYEPLDTASEG